MACNGECIFNLLLKINAGCKTLFFLKTCQAPLGRCHPNSFWSAGSKRGTYLSQCLLCAIPRDKRNRNVFVYSYSICKFTHLPSPIFQNQTLHFFGDFACGTSFTWVMMDAFTATFKRGSPLLAVQKERYESQYTFTFFEWILSDTPFLIYNIHVP